MAGVVGDLELTLILNDGLEVRQTMPDVTYFLELFVILDDNDVTARTVCDEMARVWCVRGVDTSR